MSGAEGCGCTEERLLGGAPSCDETHPDGRLICTKEPDHDGPHAACSPYGHPLEVWDDDV